MKKPLLFTLLVNLLLISCAAVADQSPESFAEAIIYIDHGCTENKDLDQCLKVEWVKDQTFSWQWYQGERKGNKPFSSVNSTQIIENLNEIFSADEFDSKQLIPQINDEESRQKWFRSLSSSGPNELKSLLALSGGIRVKADPACTEESVYNCPSRRVEFLRMTNADTIAVDSVPALEPLSGGNAEAATHDQQTASGSGWSVAGAILLILLTAGIAVLAFLLRNLLNQFKAQQSVLSELSTATLNNLRNRTRSQDSTDITTSLSDNQKKLITDSDQLAPVFYDILAPVVKDISSARLYVSLQEKQFNSSQSDEEKSDILSATQKILGQFLPDAHHSATFEEMQTVLDEHEKEQKKAAKAVQGDLSHSVKQLVKDQEDLTRQTQIAFTNLQQTIGRLDSFVKSSSEKHLFELTRAVPESLGTLKTNLANLTARSEQDKKNLEKSMLQSMQQFEEKMSDNFSVVAERVESIFRNAGSSHTIADAAKGLKAYRIIEVANLAPAKLGELESSPAVSMMSGASRWAAEISDGYQRLHEPVAQGDSISRYCAYVLDSAGLKDTLADFDPGYFDRLGIAASTTNTEEFLRLWGDSKTRAVHTDLFKYRFLLENMLFQLLQDQQEHPVLDIRDQIVPFCESISGSARMAGIQIHRVAPQTDQNLCRWFMDPCGDSGKMTQAVLNSKIEFVEIFKGWLKNVNQCNTDSEANIAIEICQLGYTLIGKSRPEKMTRVVCYKDVAWQLN